MRSGVLMMVLLACVCPSARGGDGKTEVKPEVKPNIVFILADDLGWGDLGCYGHERLKTPHLDQLAGQGARFTQFYVNGSVCSPSRCAFMTGQYPARHRIHGHYAKPEQNAARGMSSWLDPTVPNVASLLKSAGYATAHFGKWHLGHGPGAPEPNAYGFDDTRTMVSNKPGWNEPAATFWPKSTTVIVDEAIRFIRANKDKPFYVNVWTLLPHAALNPTDEQMAPYDRYSWDNGIRHKSAETIYYASVSDVDTQVGRLMDELEKLGLADRTLVVFSSDNGPEDIHITNAGHSGVGSAGPFRGRKRSLYEGGIRLPFIVRWPKHVSAGRVDDTSVIAGVDYLPTVCRLAGIEPPASHTLDGEDVSDILVGESRARHRALFWEWRFHIAGEPFHRSPILAVREGDWKLLMNPDRSRIELYDIPRDPTQLNNSADKHPDVVEQLASKVLAWQKTLPEGPMDPTAGKNDYPWPGKAAIAPQRPAGKTGRGNSPGAGKSQKRPPNILIIVADDLGYADLGCQGCKDVPTPHIDTLAAGGVRFTNGYVSCPVCSPTRAGLQTGRYQQRFGHEINPGPPDRAEPNFGLRLDEVTLAERLKKAGYVTGLVGKWHLGYQPQFHPLKRGYDEYFGFLAGSHDYFDNVKPTPVLRGTDIVKEESYLTDAFGREAAAFIERHKDQPFLLTLTFNSVHTPMQTTDRYLQRFGSIEDPLRRKLAAMLSAMDDAVGVVLSKVRDAGIENDTLIFFVSDNGGPTPTNGSRNTPLRGVKGQVFEGGIRVPFLVQWKGHIPSGKVYDQPVIALDIHPTSLAVAGGPFEIPADKPLDGVNLVPFLNGEKSGAPHEALFWRYGVQSAVRKGHYKLVKTNQEEGLFDLAADVGEQKDLLQSKPEVARELRETFDKWNAQMVPPAWGRAGVKGPAQPNQENLGKPKAGQRKKQKGE